MKEDIVYSNEEQGSKATTLFYPTSGHDGHVVAEGKCVRFENALCKVDNLGGNLHVAQNGDDGSPVDEVESFGEVSLKEGGWEVVVASVIVCTGYVSDCVINMPPLKNGALVGREDV